jgi:hypothetical protein
MARFGQSYKRGTMIWNMAWIRFTAGSIAFALVAAFVPGCARPAPSTSARTASVEDFHPSDPAIVGTTGRPQLLEFYGPT